MMNRRAFISGMAGSLLAASLAAEGQQTGKVYRIGMLETTTVRIRSEPSPAVRS
jgi:hypothetical protein